MKCELARTEVGWILQLVHRTRNAVPGNGRRLRWVETLTHIALWSNLNHCDLRVGFGERARTLDIFRSATA